MKKNQQPAEAELHLDSLEGGRWTWRYVERGVELHSNETFATRDYAAEWARKAYPDVPFADQEDEPAAESS